VNTLCYQTLELTMKLPVFAVNRARIVENGTIVLAAGDKSTLSKMDVYLDNLFSKDKDKPSHPLGGLYAFRKNEDGVFVKTFSMLLNVK